MRINDVRRWLVLIDIVVRAVLCGFNGNEDTEHWSLRYIHGCNCGDVTSGTFNRSLTGQRTRPGGRGRGGGRTTRGYIGDIGTVVPHSGHLIALHFDTLPPANSQPHHNIAMRGGGGGRQYERAIA